MTFVLDDGVGRVCRDYLESADRHASGLVQGLYLQGSVALGDYRPGTSDIDFVAVTDGVPDVAVLGGIHAELHRRHRRPFFDGLYVSRADLDRDPATAPAGPAVHEWRFDPVSRFERNLVTWHVLAQGGVAVRGPSVADLRIFTDWPALAEATRRNLDDYWRPWTRRMARSPAGLSSWAVTWGVLGVARLRHTLAAGRVTSKSEAADYALATYDEQSHRVVREAWRLRVGGPPLYRNPLTRRADMLAFLRTALDR